MQARKPMPIVLSKKRGAYPQSKVVFDSNGNLFGTTGFAGPGGYGTVWESKP